MRSISLIPHNLRLWISPLSTSRRQSNLATQFRLASSGNLGPFVRVLFQNGKDAMAVARIEELQPGGPDAVRIPLIGQSLCAGFPSPADDFLEGALELPRWLAPNPPATSSGGSPATACAEPGSSTETLPASIAA